MAINYITKDGALYDQRITQGLITSVLGVPKVEWLNGGKSFTLTTVSTSGFQPHTRNKGFNEGSVENEKVVYTMGQDRDVEFFVDTQDVDETNGDLAAARISNTFIDEHVTPEIDAYRFAKLANSTLINDKHRRVEAITKANVYSTLKAAILPVRKFGPNNIIAFLSSATMDALEQSTEFTRNITNQNVGQTALESRVTSLDGVTLIEVWDDARFKTAYDFANGFVPTDDAQDINFLVVAKPATIPAVKENAVYLFAPGEHTEGDGFLYQNRLYHDLFVKSKQADGLVVSTPSAIPVPEA